MVPTCQSNSSNLNTRKAFLNIPDFTIVCVLGVDKLDVGSLAVTLGIDNIPKYFDSECSMPTNIQLLLLPDTGSLMLLLYSINVHTSQGGRNATNCIGPMYNYYRMTQLWGVKNRLSKLIFQNYTAEGHVVSLPQSGATCEGCLLAENRWRHTLGPNGKKCKITSSENI